MDFKKKLKRFFTLTYKANDGFTLVELIIVIAILAILAGAAVPMYNGYTQKAREAADQMIVAAANDAFAAACMENKVDAMDVSAAEISVLEGKVYGLSSATYGSDTKFVDKTAPYFLTYFEGNGEMVFQTPGINSLIWNDAEDTFKMSTAVCAARVVLSDGTTITISAEDMAAILASTYADMGYSGVKEVLDQVSESGAMLAKICGLGTFEKKELKPGGSSWNPNDYVVVGYTGLLPKLTEAMKAFGIIDDNKANEMLGNLHLTSGASQDAKNQSIKEAENGLAMITAKYLASGGNVDELVAVDLGNSSAGVIEPMATGTGGTKTVSAIAVQYALASGFANSSASEGVTVEGKTVSEYLASAEDPVEAINTVKNLDAYKNNYVGSDQYNSDKNGFVATMSILGDNVGGAIDTNDYLSNGVESEDAKDVLTGVLGE